MAVWNSHVAEKYRHKLGRYSATCSFHIFVVRSMGADVCYFKPKLTF